MKKIPAIFFLATVYLSASSQVSTYNFRTITTNDGLSDGVIRSICQDKYGFIWIGTSYGLNRFDGTTIKSFFNKSGDTTSLRDNYVQALFRDADGDLWVGTRTGLSRYDYRTNCFVNFYSTNDLGINVIRQDKKGNIWLGTARGLWWMKKNDTAAYRFFGKDSIGKKINYGVNKIVISDRGEICMATYYGIKILYPETSGFQEIKFDPNNKFSISGNDVYAIVFDRRGYLWAACAHAKALVNKIDLKNKTVTYYERFTDPQKKWTPNTILNMIIDSKGNLWGTGSISGLFLYDEVTDKFTDHSNDPLFSNSLAINPNGCIYQDAMGNIWIGSSGYGISYFNPDNNLFHTILPVFRKNPVPGVWCRAVCEDRQGNIWLATGSGIAKYNKEKNTIDEIVNEDKKKPVMYLNSVRSLLEDDNGDMWIGTAGGLNRYHPSTGVMDFFNQKDGISLAFFWMLSKAKNNDIWLGSAWGLYHYIRSENRFDDLSKDSVLSKFSHRNVQALFTDSKNRLWIGLMNVGLVVYDIDTKKSRLLTIKDSLIIDTRFSSFAEERNGMIWFGSENGLVAYDYEKNHSRIYTREDGLPSNRTNNLMFDSLNRLWFGTSNGLCVLSRDRDRIKTFTINDGLPTNQFNEQAAYLTREGLFVFPTYKGFVFFDPEKYRSNRTTVPVYITSFKISEKDLSAPVNVEELSKIHLRYDENFFKIELAGLNYMNPFQCTYAYKLEPFDKDWVYTNKKEVNYTNVPAGDYTFRYKAITDNPTWNVQEKTLSISIDAIFYKTWWFRGLMVVLVAAITIAFVRYRIKHRESILELKAKAQMLEKEKALVMYESLKQQLNPHFLFNSLTSLSSLIQQDQKVARQFLDKMSKIYRYILKNRDSELVPLIDDIKLAEVYTSLQQTRFQKGLKVNFNVEEEDYHRRIVPVTLQNLVENAIKHNVIDDESPLTIDMFVEDGYLVVRNNLQKKNFVESSNKQGLASMKSLYHYLSGKSICIQEDKNYFTVKIPLV
jgi:ligand-binding sensor domain-containing protein